MSPASCPFHHCSSGSILPIHTKRPFQSERTGIRRRPGDRDPRPASDGRKGARDAAGRRCTRCRRSQSDGLNSQQSTSLWSSGQPPEAHSAHASTARLPASAGWRGGARRGRPGERGWMGMVGGSCGAIWETRGGAGGRLGRRGWARLETGRGQGRRAKGGAICDMGGARGRIGPQIGPWTKGAGHEDGGAATDGTRGAWSGVRVAGVGWETGWGRVHWGGTGKVRRGGAGLW